MVESEEILRDRGGRVEEDLRFRFWAGGGPPIRDAACSKERGGSGSGWACRLAVETEAGREEKVMEERRRRPRGRPGVVAARGPMEARRVSASAWASAWAAWIRD